MKVGCIETPGIHFADLAESQSQRAAILTDAHGQIVKQRLIGKVRKSEELHLKPRRGRRAAAGADAAFVSWPSPTLAEPRGPHESQRHECFSWECVNLSS